MNLQETLDIWRINAAKIVAENENVTYVNYVMFNIDYEILNQFAKDNNLPFQKYTNNRFYTAQMETGLYYSFYTKPVEIKHTYEVINL
jgi:hypothetical protein